MKRTHSLFVENLKVYPECCNMLKNVNKIILQASPNISACYGVLKCAGNIFEHSKMVRGEGVEVLEKKNEDHVPR